MKKLLLLTSLLTLLACNNSKLNKSNAESSTTTPHSVKDTTTIPKDTSVSKVILKDHAADQQAKIDSIKAEKNKKKRKDN